MLEVLSFDNDESALIDHRDGHGLGVAHLEGGLLRLAVLQVVAIEGGLVALVEHGKIEGQFERSTCSIVACNVPCVAMTASEHAILAWIAVDEDCLIPCGGYFAKEVHADGRGRCAFLRRLHVLGFLGRKVFGSDGEVLNRVLEEHACGQFMAIGCLASDATLVATLDVAVHETASKFHTSNGIADEWMGGGVFSLLVGRALTKIDVLRSKHGFAAHVVGIHAFPSSGNGATVEDDHDIVVVGIRENLLVVTHGLLLVASEEIDFDALHSYLLHPAHILLAEDRVAHDVDRALLDVVPPAT